MIVQIWTGRLRCSVCYVCGGINLLRKLHMLVNVTLVAFCEFVLIKFKLNGEETEHLVAVHRIQSRAAQHAAETR